ncbi:MAG: ribosome maturation factor RimP [Pseudomonadota bacterium]
MSLADEIERLIAPTVEDMGYRIVRVKLFGSGRRTLQVMAERADGSPVVVDDCADISRAVSTLLDVEDPIGGAYDLEVSSTGIDRPLVKLDDFVRFAGFEAIVDVDPPVEGRKRWRGRIIGAEDGVVRLDDGRDGVELSFDGIVKAKLALTDELIAAMAPGHEDA